MMPVLFGLIFPLLRQQSLQLRGDLTALFQLLLRLLRPRRLQTVQDRLTLIPDLGNAVRRLGGRHQNRTRLLCQFLQFLFFFL